MSAETSGWRSWQRQTSKGAVESEQRTRVDRPVVDFTEEGALILGRRYWAQIARSTRGLVRATERDGALDLRVLGRGPALLRFGQPTLAASPDLVRCSYPIRGGVLAQRADGEISFSQTGDPQPELASAIANFFPTLAARDGRPHWTGALYNFVQSRIHVAITRRYFAGLVDERRP